MLQKKGEKQRDGMEKMEEKPMTLKSMHPISVIRSDTMLIVTMDQFS